jgi:hypothetical protein
MNTGELHMKNLLTRPALLLAAALLASPASAAVQVYGEASSTGPNIRVQVFADISSASIVSHTFKLYYNASQFQILSASRNESVWYFFDGARMLPQPPPSAPAPGQVLFISGHMDARTPHAGVTGNRVLLATVDFTRNDSSTPTFDLTIGQTGQFASFVTTNGSVLEAQVGQVIMQPVKADPNDEDLDGLQDKWEDKFFGGTRGAFYSDDPDADGVNNLGEEALGSDPTDAKSNLRLAITDRREAVILEWDSAEKRTYAIEVSKELGKFETWKEGIEATPPLNTLEVDRKELGDPQFFRVRLEAAR